MSASRLRAGRRTARIGVTPLIDVVFILMIFFMLASTFARERQIELDARRTGAGAAQAARVLTASPEGLLLDGVARTADEVRALLAQSPGPVAVRPAGGVPMQALIDAADLAHAAGVERVVLAR